MIEFSCADFTFPVLTHEQSLDLISILEFKWVDIGLFKDRSHIQPSNQFDYPTEKGRALHKLASGKGLSISDVFLQSDLDDKKRAINNPDLQVRKEEREIFQRLVDFTTAACCTHCTGLPGADFDNNSKSICEEELAWRVEYADRHGIKFAVEPHLGSIMATPQKALEMLKRVKGLSVTLDHSHYTRQGFSTDSVQPMVEYASHVHARGATKGEMQTSFSRNTTDFKLVIQQLKSVGYGGKICLEYCWIEWENCNRTDNVAETMLLRSFLMANL